MSGTTSFAADPQLKVNGVAIPPPVIHELFKTRDLAITAAQEQVAAAALDLIDDATGIDFVRVNGILVDLK